MVSELQHARLALSPCRNEFAFSMKLGVMSGRHGSSSQNLAEHTMNIVYEFSGPQSDFDMAMIDARGQLVMPSFDCPSCGCDGAQPPVWYASLQPNTPEAAALCRKGFPEQVSTPEDYEEAREQVRKAFRTKAILWPGYIVGALPIEVRNRSTISGLNAKKLKRNIDFIWASMFNGVVSEKFFGILQDAGLELQTGPVVFATGEKEFTGYRVLEVEPQLVWTDAERKKYQVSLCSVCGSSLKGSVRGTFAKKEFSEAVFGSENCVLVRGIEENGIYINQPLYKRLAEAKLTGVSFKEAGRWV